MARARILAALLAATVAATACGTDDNVPHGAAPATTAPQASTRPADCAAGSVTGAGSTFVLTLAQQWIKDYGAACPGAAVNYQGVGSGAGVQQLLAGTVDVAGSDAVLTPDEQRAAEAKGGPVVHVPWAAGGVAVLYNLPGVARLRLSPAVIAGIFAGAIIRWNDPAVARDNPSAHLPTTAISVVHRSDGSGTTKVFTEYLTAVAPDVWKSGAAKDVPWPTGIGAKGSDGVAAAVKQTAGAIGYAEVAFATAAGVGVAAVRNPAGRYVLPTATSVTAALRDATVPPDLKVKVTYTPRDPGAYPISTTTWAITFARPADSGRAHLLRSFLLYALGPGQTVAARLGYAPLPQELAVRAQAAVYGLP